MNLDFSEGVQDITINGKCTVRVNLTDFTFIESVFNAFDALDALEDEYQKRFDTVTDGREIFALCRERDARMREIVNDIFGEDVCSPIFGKMQLTAIGDGLPLWFNLLMAFIDNMDSTIAREKKQSNPRMKKYVDKYQKYQKK